MKSEVPLGPQDGLVSGWSPAAPAAGSWRFLLFKGSFIPGGLIPGRARPTRAGYFAEGGAWSRVATGNVGLCGPQLLLRRAASGLHRPAEEVATGGRSRAAIRA